MRGELGGDNCGHFLPFADHSDRYPLPDRKYFELTLRRRHLLATTEGLDGDNVQEYAVIKAVILNPSRCMDVLLVLSEVPPDFAAPVDVGKGWCIGGERGGLEGLLFSILIDPVLFCWLLVDFLQLQSRSKKPRWRTV